MERLTFLAGVSRHKLLIAVLVIFPLIALGKVIPDGLTLDGSTDGIDINPGSDVDVDILTIGVTGTPTLSWDESADSLRINDGLILGAEGDGTHTIGGSSINSTLEVHSEGGTDPGGLSVHRHTNSQPLGGHVLTLRSRDTHASPAIVQTSDIIGRFVSVGYDGTDYEMLTDIQSVVDGVPGAGDMPGRLDFLTTPDGSGTPVLGMRIDSDQAVGIGSGTITKPGLNFISDTDVGIYRSTTDTFDLVSGGYLGLQVKKSTGNYTNIGMGGANASVSDDYPLLIERNTDQPLNVQISNPSANAAASARFQLKADAGNNTAEIGVWANSSVDAYGKYLAVRSTDSALGNSYIADNAAGVHKFYNAGVAATDESFRIYADHSWGFMREIATPSNPSSNSYKVYAKSDGNIYKLNSAGVEKRLGGGSGSGVNYHDDFEADDINKVAEYDDAGTTEPVDGTGGSPSVTSSLNTSSPISGTASYRLEKPASDVQGQGWSIDSDTLATLETDGSEAVWLNFSYTTPGAYTSGDYTVWVYRVGSNTLEALNTFQGSSFTNDLPAAPNGGRYSGWVTPSSSDTELRLIIHVGTTSTTAMNMQMDRVSIGPAAQVQLMSGGPIGEVITWPSTDTPNDFLYCDGTAVSRTTYAALFDVIGTTHGTGDGSTTFNLPDYEGRFLRGQDNSAARDPDRAARTAMNTGGNTGDNVGSIQGDEFESHQHVQMDNVTDPANGVLRFDGTGSVAGFSGQNRYTQATGGNETRPINANVRYYIRYQKSGNAMSTAELAVRSLYVNAYNISGQTIGTASATKRTGWTEDEDTHGVFDASAGSFEAPHNGKFVFTHGYLFNSSISSRTLGYITHYQSNGTTIIADYTTFHAPSGSESGGFNSQVIKMNKGEKVFFRVYHSEGTDRTLNSSGSFNVITIAEVPDLTVIGVNGVNEGLSEYSSTKTPSASGHWHNHTGNSVELTPGTWRLSGAVSFGNSGAPSYTSFIGRWASADGADSASAPGTVTLEAGFNDVSGTWAMDSFVARMDTVRIKVTATTTVYLATYATMTTPANARIATSIYAERIQ